MCDLLIRRRGIISITEKSDISETLSNKLENTMGYHLQADFMSILETNLAPFRDKVGKKEGG
jgi:hypothetical protein